MTHERSTTAIVIFFVIVGFTLWLSFYLGKRAKSAQGFFAAGGGIHWFVNGVAFAGDYLSAASFLGICGMIAFYGYDGFLYSIGFLGGWVTALLVIAEPLKRLGKYTLADALDAKFQSPGIKLAVAISTLIVSVFYLIPQMVGAGALVKPLLGFAHYQGVMLVGAVVTVIVATAGMVSTTYVQFLKGMLLVVFSAVLVGMILMKGFTVNEIDLSPQRKSKDKSETTLRPSGTIAKLPGGKTSTGPLDPISYLQIFRESEITTWSKDPKLPPDSYVAKTVTGADMLLPGNSFKGIRSDKLAPKLDFMSLMTALFFGTASLPHILIRYYTVRDQAAARKSTIVGIAFIGFFYILTLYIGLGAMTSGALDVSDTNMAAPLLARSIGEWLFAVISAIAFTTVLGTVSGLIIAAAGAVVHDLLSSVMKISMNDHAKVRAAKIASVAVGIVGIMLGIVCEKMNVAFLVGCAFNIAASANLPSLLMLLFWSRTTKQGIIAAVSVGLFSSLGWILLNAEFFDKVYGLPATSALAPFNQPAIVTIPLGFLTLIVVSLLTPKRSEA